MKNENKIKIYDHKRRNIAILAFVFIIIIIICSFIYNQIMKKKIAKEIVTELVDKNQEIEWLEDEDNQTIKIEQIIKENTNQNIKEVIETKVVELEYETEYRNNSSLPKGTIQVLQQGKDGKQELIIKKQYQGDTLISDEQIGRKITANCIDRIVEVGTSKYYNKHTIKIGEIVYATPYELDIKEEPNKDATVIMKVNQNAKLKIEKKDKNWYYVRHSSYYGWIESDCVTYILPTTFNDKNINYSKKELLANLNKNMLLNKPSGLTLEQFEKIFANESKDKNGTFKANAKYFYYIEQAYQVNGVFVAAVGIHESNWGQSKIATDKKNLFGYGAYDKSAYTSAYNYTGYEAGIDMIARVLAKHYLNPKGTSIYNGEIATGKYYNGATLAGVNKKYATDKNWANSVYIWMKYLYNQL